MAVHDRDRRYQKAAEAQGDNPQRSFFMSPGQFSANRVSTLTRIREPPPL
jgi:hypothetical protein